MEMNLTMVASLVHSDRKKGLTYKLINKYTGPLPQTVTITKEVKR